MKAEAEDKTEAKETRVPVHILYSGMAICVSASFYVVIKLFFCCRLFYMHLKLSGQRVVRGLLLMLTLNSLGSQNYVTALKATWLITYVNP